jgi:brefeldin A-resistance guanine nucleotide exchange factor 1
MRKNARWSGMGVSGLRMGGLGNSMGLRSAQINSKDSHKKEVQVYYSLSLFLPPQI